GKVHIINFEMNPDIHVIFEQNLDSNRIISDLEMVLNNRIKPDEDLLFFDEIQECPKAIMSLRYFYEQNPAIHIIAAGSLLEFALQNISFPIGRLQLLSMYPMTFKEFLIANQKTIILERIANINEPPPDNIIKIINEELYKYFIIGGMPECVKTFIKTNSYVKVSQIQSDLIATFRQDFSKYAGHSDKRCLNAVLSSVSQKVGTQIKYTHLSDSFSQPTIKKAYQLLNTANLFTNIKSASPTGIPLGASVSDKKNKAVFLDIGLLSNINGFQSLKLLPEKKMQAAFNGMMAEQFIGQELQVTTNENLYFWSRSKRSSNAEIDYLIEKNGEIIPIEVKSGASGSLKSLHLLLNTFKNIKISYVFTNNKYGEIPEQKIKFFPLYCVGFT
ncbi:MAG: DUF4143 domain-containing protein, partial [Bacteroidota bacterium]|nr:DUF4143 domain-containing protein [Bacteroidota bacterium]